MKRGICKSVPHNLPQAHYMHSRVDCQSGLPDSPSRHSSTFIFKMSHGKQIEEVPKLQAMGLTLGLETSTPGSLCSNCSGSVLMTTPWETLLRKGKQQPQIVHIWGVELSDQVCELCRFIEKEAKLSDMPDNIAQILSVLRSFSGPSSQRWIVPMFGAELISQGTF